MRGTLALLAVMALMQATGFAAKIEIDNSKETLTNGQLYSTTNLYLSSEFESNTLVFHFQNSDRNGNIDNIYALGGYFNLSKELYAYVNLFTNPAPNALPKDAVEFEAGWAGIKPWVITGNYRRRNYPSLHVETYGIGTDYYLPFPAWIYLRGYLSKSSDDTTSSSAIIKLFSDTFDRTRIYVGYATGSEAYKDISTAAVFGFNANTPMIGIRYQLSDCYTIKADLSKEYRSNNVDNTLVGLGVSATW